MVKKAVHTNDSATEDVIVDRRAAPKNSHKARLDEVFEHLPTAIIITDAVGHPVECNQTAIELLGRVPANTNPLDWPERFGLYLDDSKTYYPGESLPLLRALEGEKVENVQLIHTNGLASGISWISMSAKPLISQQGKIEGALVYLSDITSTKVAELHRQEQIRRAELSYELSQQIAKMADDPKQILTKVVIFAAENIGDGCVAALLNLPGDRLRIVASHHNKPSASALLHQAILTQDYGLAGTIESVIRSGEPLLIPTIDQDRIKEIAKPEQIQYVDEFGIQSLLVAPIKGRNKVLGTLSLFRDRYGGQYTAEDQSYIMDVAHRTGMAIDNNSLVRMLHMESSGRRIAEEALEFSEARFRSIFTSTALGIKLLDLDGNILETNTAFQQMLGYAEDELRGRSLTSIWHPVDEKSLIHILDELKKDPAQSFQLEHRLLSKDGSIIWVNVTFTGIKKNELEETLAFIVAIAENITKRKLIETEMLQMKSRLHNHVEMQRLQLAQELHDGPMQDLYSAIFKIEKWGDKLDQENRAQIEFIKGDLLNVIHGLRNTAKDLRPPALANFGLEKAIRSHAEEFSASHPGLVIRLNLARDMQILPEDVRLILFRIYQHSLTNVLRHAQASLVDIQFTFDAEKAQLEISDNGVGFEVPSNWMELVRQGHFGLAGAVERVELMEGLFTVESTPGVGTTVRVTLPIRESVEL